MQYNHPRDPSCIGLSSSEILKIGFDAIEAIGAQDDLRQSPDFVKFCHTHNIVMTAGSDTHEPGKRLVCNIVEQGDWKYLFKNGPVAFEIIPPEMCYTPEITNRTTVAALDLFTNVVEGAMYPMKWPFKTLFPIKGPSGY